MNEEKEISFLKRLMKNMPSWKKEKDAEQFFEDPKTQDEIKLQKDWTGKEFEEHAKKIVMHDKLNERKVANTLRKKTEKLANQSKKKRAKKRRKLAK